MRLLYNTIQLFFGYATFICFTSMQDQQTIWNKLISSISFLNLSIMDDKLLPKLFQNLFEILNDDEFYDVLLNLVMILI